MRYTLLGSTALWAASSTLALAQDGPVDLPPVILETGLRDSRNILDTPVAASVVEGEALERRQADTYQELIGDVPGVTIEGGPRGISQEPNIRGFQDEQIVLRFDGARQNFNQAHRGRFFFDPDIVQRIEVIRGGGSTLYGSGALGGVIAVETKDPADLLRDGETTGARLRFGAASNGEVLSPTATVFGDWGQWDALAFVGIREMGDSLEDGNGDEITRSELDAANALVKFGFEPTNDQRFEFGLSYYEDEGLTPPNANAPAEDDNEIDRSAEVLNTRFAWDYKPENSDVIDLSVLLYSNSLDISEDRPTDGREDETEYDTYGFEVVNRSRFNAGVPITLVYGIDAYQDEQTGTRDGAPREQFPDAEATTYGGFLEATVGVSTQLDLIAGARFDSYERETDDPALDDVDETFFAPRIGFSYRPNANWQIFGNLAEAYRAPTLTELYNDGVHFVVPFGPFLTGINNFTPTPDLKEEDSVQIELGTRYETAGVWTAGDVLRVSANAYYAEVEDFIDTVVTDFDFSTAFTGFVFAETFQRNVDAELWGVEAEVDYDAGPWFAGLGLSIPRGEQTNGDPLGSIPQDRLTATLGWRPSPEITMGLRTTFASGQDDVPDGSVEGESYELVDLFASWTPRRGAMEGAILRAGIDNVFDEQYTIFPNDLPQPGRTFKVSVAYQF